MKLRTGRWIKQRRETLPSKKRLMLAQFEVSQGEKTPNCSRSKGAGAGDDESKERETDRGVEIWVLVMLFLFLLNETQISILSLFRLIAGVQLPLELTREATLISTMALVRA